MDTTGMSEQTLVKAIQLRALLEELGACERIAAQHWAAVYAENKKTGKPMMHCRDFRFAGEYQDRVLAMRERIIQLAVGS